MKKYTLIVFVALLIPQVTNAENAINQTGQIINSRIFSTQAAHQYETLERTNYTNNAIKLTGNSIVETIL